MRSIRGSPRRAERPQLRPPDISFKTSNSLIPHQNGLPLTDTDDQSRPTSPSLDTTQMGGAIDLSVPFISDGVETMVPASVSSLAEKLKKHLLDKDRTILQIQNADPQ